jgi:protein tyrosine/serine phosphatase
MVDQEFKPNSQDLPNFSAVTETTAKSFLYRGGQPSADGFAILQTDFAVKTVICLRSWDTDWEQQTCSSLGLNYVYSPLPIKLSSTSEDDFLSFVRSFFVEVQNRPRNIFIHCHQGIDRTGLMIALYRMCVDNWAFDAAFQEMENFGYRGILHQVFLSRLKDTLYDWWANSRCSLAT